MNSFLWAGASQWKHECYSQWVGANGAQFKGPLWLVTLEINSMICGAIFISAIQTHNWKWEQYLRDTQPGNQDGELWVSTTRKLTCWMTSSPVFSLQKLIKFLNSSVSDLYMTLTRVTLQLALKYTGLKWNSFGHALQEVKCKPHEKELTAAGVLTKILPEKEQNLCFGKGEPFFFFLCQCHLSSFLRRGSLIPSKSSFGMNPPFFCSWQHEKSYPIGPSGERQRKLQGEALGFLVLTPGRSR